MLFYRYIKKIFGEAPFWVHFFIYHRVDDGCFHSRNRF